MDWKLLTLPADATIRDGLKNIDQNTAKFILVVDSDTRLLGTVTDGNIRRAMLNGATLETPLGSAMTPHPITLDARATSEQALALMVERDITHVPALDTAGHILWLWSRHELESTRPLPNAVVVMAGGLGSRLGALTQSTPKPMLSVAGRPILEVLLENFIAVGFRRFYIAVNYRAEQIKDYFGDGTSLGCDIAYLHEKERLGTAGALSLLPEQELPFVVTNADLLTRFNVRCLLAHHVTTGAQATMLAKRFTYKVPYGVVECSEQGHLLAIREKPETSYQVAAGMYVLNPDVVRHIPSEQFFDMPDLLARLVQQEQTVAVMPTESYWLDIGRPPDFEQAQREFDRC